MKSLMKIFKIELHIGEKWAHPITLTEPQFDGLRIAMGMHDWFHIVPDPTSDTDGEWINTASITYMTVETTYMEE